MNKVEEKHKESFVKSMNGNAPYETDVLFAGHAAVTQDIATGFNRWIYHSSFRVRELGWSQDDEQFFTDEQLYNRYIDTL